MSNLKIKKHKIHFILTRIIMLGATLIMSHIKYLFKTDGIVNISSITAVKT